jgi:hypothetical protein
MIDGRLRESLIQYENPIEVILFIYSFIIIRSYNLFNKFIIYNYFQITDFGGADMGDPFKNSFGK